MYGAPFSSVPTSIQRDALIELQVRGGDHDSHAALTEHALDSVFAGKDIAFTDFRHGRSSLVAHPLQQRNPKETAVELRLSSTASYTSLQYDFWSKTPPPIR